MTKWRFIALFVLVLFMFEVFPLRDKYNTSSMIAITFIGEKLVRKLAV